MVACLSMIIHDLDFVRPLIAPAKHDAPLIVDPDRILSSEVPSQGLNQRCERASEASDHGPYVSCYDTNDNSIEDELFRHVRPAFRKLDIGSPGVSFAGKEGAPRDFRQ